MEEKKIDPGMTSNSSHLASMYGNDFVELVWKNGEIVVQGGSSSSTSMSRTRKRASCIEYSRNPPCLEDPCITKRARLNNLYSLLHSNSHYQTHRQPSYQLFDFYDTKINTSFSNNKLEHDLSNSRAASKETNNSKTTTTVGSTQLRSSSSHSGSYQRFGKLNFSNFVKPALFVKSSYMGRNGGVSARVEEFKAGTDHNKNNNNNNNSNANSHSLVIDSSANKRSHSLSGIQHQAASTCQKAKQTPIVAKSDEKTLVLPNTQGSHAQTHKAEGKFGANEAMLNVATSSSMCSLGASNNPTQLPCRKHENTDDSYYITDNDEELLAQDVIKEAPSREASRGKRTRNPATHNLSERKRRDEINKKMRALKELIPNCNKMDKASMLDDAIDYLKTLKLQLQVMSMGSSLCNPLMMGGGILSLRPSGIGIPYSLPMIPNMNIPHLSLHNNMLAFPNHMFPIPFSPFNTPMPPNHSTTTTTTLHASLPTNSNLNAQLLCPMQPSTDQGTN